MFLLDLNLFLEGKLILLDLSEEYQLPQIQSSCVKYITEADKSGTQSLKFISYLQKHKELQHILKTCLKNLQTIPLRDILQNEDFLILDDQTKLLVTSTRAEHLEQTMDEHKMFARTLVEKLYQSVHNSYIGQLTEKGYEESLLAYCEKKDQHKSDVKSLHCKFDISCESCRRRVRMVKEFKVRMKDVEEMMERLCD